jgi:hypothetical protein
MDIGRSIARPSLHPIGGRAWRDLGRLVGEALAAGLAVSLVLALAAFIVSAQTPAADVSTMPPAPHAGARGAAEPEARPPAPDARPATLPDAVLREPRDEASRTLAAFATSAGDIGGIVRAAGRVLA